MLKRLSTTILFAFALLLGAATATYGQPFAAQIQVALRRFLTEAHAWTGEQTVSVLNLVSTGVQLSAADGVLTLLGLGNGNDESLTIDLDNATANHIALSSGSGADRLKWAGNFSVDGYLLSGSDVYAGGSGYFGGNGGSASKLYLGAANGQANLENAAGTSGIGFDFATDSILKISNRAQNAGAALQASALYTAGTAPTVGNVGANSCGTTAATITATATDSGGKVTVGATSGTECRVTFVSTWPNAPACFVSNETTANLSRAQSTTTTVDLEGVFVAGDVLAWSCSGQQ